MTQQTEPTTRRGVVLYPANPFMEAGLVKAKTKRITNKRGEMMVMGDSGEIVAPVAGFGTPKKWTARSSSSSTSTASRRSKT